MAAPAAAGAVRASGGTRRGGDHRGTGAAGVATPPVLVPRRRNAVRLLMLIDRHGSMTPFHGYVDYVVGAIRDAGRIDDVQAVYFHDLPGSRDGQDGAGPDARPVPAGPGRVLALSRRCATGESTTTRA